MAFFDSLRDSLPVSLHVACVLNAEDSSTRSIDLSGERGRVVRSSGLRCQILPPSPRFRHTRSVPAERAQRHVYPAAWRWAAWEARESVFVVVCAVEG
ncbi:hypothetical protein FA13DRAFT_1154576 [Coprinellus micaceus]|uniref:Uncharacterized protein n=1 Tax=Coprinellus micaceus TaxID=71717 RepID=A0A4Y7RCI7_COPMI|nr:hypothetical protein FA13DRAFT_1154576 [Coprinellus micaceus]